MIEKPFEVGDRVKVTVKRYKKTIEIVGTVKECKTVYGRNEYLIGDTSTADFWARSVEKA